MTALLAVALWGCQADDPGKKTGSDGLVFERRQLLPRPPGNQQSTNVRLAPLGWGPPVELVLTETSPPRITWVGCEDGGCAARAIPVPRGLAPARSSTADLDGDGDNDLIFASIGELKPTNDRVGSVWVLWADGEDFVPERLAHDMGRACCAEPGDLDGDGDLDLTVCAFGHETPGVLGWLEQAESGWEQHILDPQPGAIHAFPIDVDADGDLDVVAAFSQLEEAVYLYRNDGAGGFSRETLYDRDETWWGTSGIEPVDLDQDGDIDLLLTNGDTMDGDYPEGQDPASTHGIAWLENDGAGGFEWREIARIWGAYTTRAADFDGDGDLDVVVGTMQMLTDFPGSVPSSLAVFVNDGDQGFARMDLVDAPPQIVSIEVADLDQDGQIDVALGSLEFQPDSATVRLDAFMQQGKK